MKDDVFFDTNVIVYLFDKSEDRKHKIAKTLFQEGLRKYNSFISVQVINEFIVIASQKIKKPLLLNEVKKIAEFLSDTLNVRPLEFATCMSAIKVKNKYNLSFWDSLVISSALESECKVLYTEDLQDGLMINDKLTIKNPFKKNRYKQ